MDRSFVILNNFTEKYQLLLSFLWNFLLFPTLTKISNFYLSHLVLVYDTKKLSDDVIIRISVT